MVVSEKLAVVSSAVSSRMGAWFFFFEWMILIVLAKVEAMSKKEGFKYVECLTGLRHTSLTAV
jgi:hypothetical protein